MSDCTEPIRYGLLMAAVASTTVGIFYALRAAGVRQYSALLTSYVVGMLYVFTGMKNVIF